METTVIQTLGDIFTVEVVVVGIIIGFVSETFKRLLLGLLSPEWKAEGSAKRAGVKTLLAILPVALGAAAGHFFIEGGSAHPVALGMVSGIFCTQIYSVVSPSTKLVESKVRKSDDS